MKFGTGIVSSKYSEWICTCGYKKIAVRTISGEHVFFFHTFASKDACKRKRYDFLHFQFKKCVTSLELAIEI